MRSLFVSGILLISLGASSATLVSQSVAEVNSKHLTSRQVILTALLSVCMKGNCSNTKSVVTDTKSDAFVGQLSKAIFERLAYFESIGVFEEYKPITKAQIGRAMSARLAKKLQFNQQEILKTHKIKTLAKKYIDFKDKNLSVYITNSEAKKYYIKNKASYVAGKMSDHMSSIKSLLRERRKRLRVEDWVVNMQTKYRVKQFIN